MRRIGGVALLALATACGGGEEPVERDEVETLAGDLPPSVPAPEVEAGILIATPERVREWQEDSVPFVLVDARDSVQFAQEHIPGAINISYVDIRPGARLPPRDARIVIYCSDADCPISQYAYDAFTRLGYGELYDMREGLRGWKESGYPTTIGATVDAEEGEPGGD